MDLPHPTVLNCCTHPHAHSGHLSVPKGRLKLRRCQALDAAAPKLWKELPLHLRQTSSISVFKNLLETQLFSLAVNCFLWLLIYFNVLYFYLIFIFCRFYCFY